MKIIEVFKTNITESSEASYVVDSLLKLLPHSKINVDLDDCDNILRIESVETISAISVQAHLNKIGYDAELLA